MLRHLENAEGFRRLIETPVTLLILLNRSGTVRNSPFITSFTEKSDSDQILPELFQIVLNQRFFEIQITTYSSQGRCYSLLFRGAREKTPQTGAEFKTQHQSSVTQNRAEKTQFVPSLGPATDVHFFAHDKNEPAADQS